MKTLDFFSALVLAAAVCCPLARAQENASPAPTTAPAINVAEPAVIDHVVFLARLPTPAELMKGAEMQGTAITRMDQTADRILVVYQYAGGRTVTFAYTLLSSAGTAPAPVAPPGSTATYSVVTAAAAPTSVVYTQPETVVYRSYPRYVRYYDSAWNYWAPFAVGVGIGWAGGYYGHGGYYGGYSSGHYGGHGGRYYGGHGGGSSGGHSRGPHH